MKLLLCCFVQTQELYHVGVRAEAAVADADPELGREDRRDQRPAVGRHMSVTGG